MILSVSTLSRMLPPRLRDSLNVLLGRAAAAALPTEPAQLFDCPVCGADRIPLDPVAWSRLRELDKHQHVYSIFTYETWNYEHYSCSRCGATDRARLYALYLGQAIGRPTAPLSVLEIAPGGAFTKFLKSLPQVRLRTADLYMRDVDDRVDLTDMRAHYADGQFDAFVCSHVLEHIPNDVSAMKELHRVTKNGGWGIAMVPINLAIAETDEDPSIVDEAGRWKHFGQGDHVRVYSKTCFVRRLKSAGFSVEQLGQSHFGENVFARHGIHPRSVLYIVRR